MNLRSDCSIIIDISSLNQIKFSSDKTKATIGGGVMNEDLVQAAYAHDIRLASPTCPCLGFLGAVLGDRQTRTAGLYGMAVDSLVSANVVLASGEMKMVDSIQSPDLFWAIKGSAANFVVVTSAEIRTYPTPRDQNVAWQATLTFSENKLESLLQALQDLMELKPHMAVDLLFATAPAPSYTTVIQVLALYTGATASAEKVFISILSLGPSNKTVAKLPYRQWDTWSEDVCVKGQRKPGYAASLARIDVDTWKTVYTDYKRFVASDPSVLWRSSILAEMYPVAKAQDIGDRTSSYPFRDLPLHVIALPWYVSSSLDTKANEWGAKIRGLWWQTAGTVSNSSYINFAHGDETLETVYGSSLNKLKQLKRVYDPKNRFNQWFPLAPR